MTPYDSALAWLYALEAAKGMDFKLERVELALERLGQPHRRYPSVHIAGTNGKGSVAAMTHAMLSAAGYRVGLYTSPHLVQFTERIRVGDCDIAAAEVAELVTTIRSQVTSRGIDLTFFEFTTVMAFVHFAAEKVDAAVVEVGLGGRLDATNVIDPAVTVVTTIGFDHETYLGHTIPAIASEKGGIIKPGRPVVLGRVAPEAGAVLSAIARDRHSPLYAMGRDFHIERGALPTYSGVRHRWPDLRLSLRGEFQHDNAATALAAIELLAPGFAVPEAAVRQGLATVQWPGRFEVVGTSPLIIFDGAHNPAGTAALIHEAVPLLHGRYVRLIFAAMEDKQWLAMARTLAPLAHEATVTNVLPPRGAAPARLAEVFRPTIPTEIVDDPGLAFRCVSGRAGARDAILVTGSLYLIGAIHSYRRQQQRRQDPDLDRAAP